MRIALPFAAAALLLAAAPAGAAEAWQTYTNTAHGYTLCFPPDLLEPQAEWESVEGRSFTARDGTELTVWQAVNDFGATAAKLQASNIENIEKAGATVSYRFAKGETDAVSGRSADTIYYAWDRLIEGDAILSLRIHYPVAAAGTWDPLVARLVACFKPGDI